MVKIERRETEQTKLAVDSLAREKIKFSGRCNTDEVVIALQEIFHNKCYICESNHATSWEVEHLNSHAGNIDLKFDWNNLFWSCGHCNHIKGTKFSPILDCTKVAVDEVIAFRKIFSFDKNCKEQWLLKFEIVSNLDNGIEIQMTCNLLQRVYYGKTLQEQVGAKMLRHDVLKELRNFQDAINDYNTATGEDKKDLFISISSKLKSASPFAAFKRWIVRDNPILCKDFKDCWEH